MVSHVTFVLTGYSRHPDLAVPALLDCSLSSE